MKYLLPLIVALLLLVVLMATGCSPKISAPKNIQAKVVEVIERKKDYVFVKCEDMKGECLFLKYYSRNARLVYVNSWLTVYGSYDDKKDAWIRAKIKLNL